MKKIIILILCLFVMTGCYNYIELDELAVVSSIFIDKEDDNFKIGIEVYDEDDKVQIFDDAGPSLTEAFNSAEEKSKKKFYFRHINAVIITDRVNIEDIVYYFFRNPDTNDNFAFVYTNQDKIYEDEEVNIGELIKNNIDDDDLCSFFEIMKGHINKLRDFAVPMFDGKKLGGMKTYKDLEPKEEFDSIEEEIFKVLKNKYDGFLHSECGDKDFVINIDSIKTDFKIDKKIKIDIKLKTSIQEMNCDLDITKVKDLNKLQDMAEKDLEKRMLEFMDTLKENETDILGINTLIKNKYKKLDKKFNEYDYEANAEISIYKKGLLLK